MEKDTEVKTRMLEELDRLVLIHQGREQELKKENQLLRLKLDKAFNTLEDQIQATELLKSKHERQLADELGTSSEQLRHAKRMLKDAVTELKKSKIESSSSEQVQQEMDQFLKEANVHDSIQSLFDGSRYQKA